LYDCTDDIGRQEDLPAVLIPECEGVDSFVVLKSLFIFQYIEAFFNEVFIVVSFASVNKFSVDKFNLYQLETRE